MYFGFYEFMRFRIFERKLKWIYQNQTKLLPFLEFRGYFFLILAIIVVVSIIVGKLPKGVIGALAFMIILGTLLNEVGDRLPHY